MKPDWTKAPNWANYYVICNDGRTYYNDIYPENQVYKGIRTVLHRPSWASKKKPALKELEQALNVNQPLE
jgi:hypothetical protein